MAKNLDLHGCQADEVWDRMDSFLQESNSISLKKVRIVCGKGKGIVRKEAIRYLKAANYPWQYETRNGKKNEGVLVIFLN